MEEQSIGQKNAEQRARHTLREIYKGPIFTVETHTVYLPRGEKSYDIVKHDHAVAIVPISNDGKIILIKQWRRAMEEILIEIPAGLIEKDEKPFDCGQRELQEEIGYKAGEMIPFGKVYNSPGFCDELLHLFIARELIPSTLPKEESEAIDLFPVTPTEALELIRTGQIRDAKTHLGLLHYFYFFHKI
jgi:ADP-ribose diphosphatase